MTFDDQLRRAFDTLSDRLRDELERQMRGAMDELAASARDERDAAIAAAQAERDAAVQSAEATQQAAIASAHAEHQAAVRALEADRDRAQADRDAAIASAQAERDAAIAAAQAERDAAVAAAHADRDAAIAAASAVPAVRAADNGDDPVAHLAAGVRALSGATTLTAVLRALIAAAETSGAMASIWLVRGQQLQPWRPNGASAPPEPLALDADHPIADAARSKASAQRDDVVALPLTLAGEVIAVLATASPDAAAPNAHALEVLALYASRALESITAFQTARALTRQNDHADAARTDAHGDTTGALDADEAASAQRYAKLLVSEIKLYHEAEVVEGRRDRDLATRLGGEIARARVMYEQRVPPHVRQQADYFHDELVRTLANGDPALLEVRS